MKTQSLKDQSIAEIKLSYHPNVDLQDCLVVKDSNSASKIFLKNWDMDTIGLAYHFKVMLLNRASKVLGIYTPFHGSVRMAEIDPKLIFAAALKANASAMIIAHNRPSENVKPSENDKALTNKIKEGSKLLDLDFKDHLIVCKETYFSFADEGVL